MSATPIQPHQDPALTNVALVDIKSFAAIGGVSKSWLLAKVAAGEAPAPVVRLPRCTRWKYVDAIRFWAEFADSTPSQGQALKERAKNASAIAKAKRLASKPSAPAEV